MKYRPNTNVAKITIGLYKCDNITWQKRFRTTEAVFKIISLSLATVLTIVTMRFVFVLINEHDVCKKLSHN